MTARRGAIRCVQICASAAATIRREAARSRDGNETGGILLGRPHGDGTAEVRCAGDPGRWPSGSRPYLLRDLDHAQHIPAEAFAHDGSFWIGEWHTHPNTAPVPSYRDLDTYARLLADPGLRFDAIVSMIIAAPDHHWDDHSRKPGLATLTEPNAYLSSLTNNESWRGPY